MSALIRELNELLAGGEAEGADAGGGSSLAPEDVAKRLSEANRAVFDLLPAAIRGDLLRERDPHGNVQARARRAAARAALGAGSVARRECSAGRCLPSCVWRARAEAAVLVRTGVQQGPGRHAPLPARARQLPWRELSCAHGAGAPPQPCQTNPNPKISQLHSSCRTSRRRSW